MASKSTSNLVSGLILLVIVLGFGFVINPMRQNTEATKASFTELDSQLSSKKAEIDTLNDLNNKLPQNDLQRKALLTLAPEELNQNELLESLSNVATSNGITLHSLNFDRQGEDEKIKGLKTVSISASFTGAYGDLIKFLKSVESINRTVIVKSVNLQRESLNENSPITFNLHLESYYQ